MVPGQGRGLPARRWSALEVERFRYLWATAPPGLLIIRRSKLSIEMLTTTPRTLVFAFITNHRGWLAASLLATALALPSCAALQPPSATGPRGNESSYPILVTEDSHRKESIAVALNRLAAQAGTPGSIEAQVQPVTTTILNISPKANSNLYLPKVGATAVMTEEETRESLRRFIKEWQELIGSDRGDYGKLQIRFTSDRRVLNLTSSCIPDAERIQTAISALTGRIRSRDAIQQLRDKGLTYTNPQGAGLNFKVPAASEINPRSLVIYILPAKNKPDALEFHVAWEMELSNAPIKIAYIDAFTGETIAVE